MCLAHHSYLEIANIAFQRALPLQAAFVSMLYRMCERRGFTPEMPLTFMLSFIDLWKCNGLSSKAASNNHPRLHLYNQCQDVQDCLHIHVDIERLLPAYTLFDPGLVSISAHTWAKPEDRVAVQGDNDSQEQRQTPQPQLQELAEPHDDKIIFIQIRNLMLNLPAEITKTVDMGTRHTCEVLLLMDKYQLRTGP
ncbi:uncharacterized protein BDW70DRAFT_124840 [Aspergillus foveolatus]|uniref:uncharacterized protein n=1 Tax=Aspergillus foveolatus TaxID=210207 RepID=UPI003CCE2F93